MRGIFIVVIIVLLIPAILLFLDNCSFFKEGLEQSQSTFFTNLKKDIERKAKRKVAKKAKKSRVNVVNKPPATKRQAVKTARKIAKKADFVRFAAQEPEKYAMWLQMKKMKKITKNAKRAENTNAQKVLAGIVDNIKVKYLVPITDYIAVAKGTYLANPTHETASNWKTMSDFLDHYIDRYNQAVLYYKNVAKYNPSVVTNPLYDDNIYIKSLDATQAQAKALADAHAKDLADATKELADVKARADVAQAQVDTQAIEAAQKALANATKTDADATQALADAAKAKTDAYDMEVATQALADAAQALVDAYDLADAAQVMRIDINTNPVVAVGQALADAIKIDASAAQAKATADALVDTAKALADAAKATAVAKAQADATRAQALADAKVKADAADALVATAKALANAKAAADAKAVADAKALVDAKAAAVAKDPAFANTLANTLANLKGLAAKALADAKVREDAAKIQAAKALADAANAKALADAAKAKALVDAAKTTPCTYKEYKPDLKKKKGYTCSKNSIGYQKKVSAKNQVTCKKACVKDCTGYIWNDKFKGCMLINCPTTSKLIQTPLSSMNGNPWKGGPWSYYDKTKSPCTNL